MLAMNYKIVCSLVGMVAVILGLCMFLCLPWGLPALGGGPEENRGVVGLLLSGGLAFLLGAALIFLGRGCDDSRFFRKEAIVTVSVCWIVAIILGAAPYLFSRTQRSCDTPVSISDALFESASGLTTTGATVFEELEDPVLMPRCILFWRGATHFLGGLGVMCFFVVVLGQGASGKAVMKLERAASGKIPIAKMRSFASTLFAIYLALNLLCCVALICCGMSVFDAISHAFSAIALGGFGTHNASVAHFTLCPSTNGLAVELTLTFFMLLAGTNFWLLYWVLRGQPGKLFRDSEWRTYVVLVGLGITVAFGFGLAHGDFRALPKQVEAPTQDSEPRANSSENIEKTPLETLERQRISRVDVVAKIDRATTVDVPCNRERLDSRPGFTIDPDAETASLGSALCRAAFQVVSLATGAGFVLERYELWNSVTLMALVLLMFVGGCSGSTAGGAKVFRVLLSGKALFQNLARTFSPNVVRVTRLDGENVDKDSLYAALAYVFVLGALILVVAAGVAVYEPDSIWIARGESQVEKMNDLFVAALAMCANVGPALGAFGSFENYGALTDLTKIIFAWVMLLGRLEVWTLLALFSPNFWRDR